MGKGGDVIVTWTGPVFALSGYGTHNREMVLALDRLGVEVRVQPTDKTPQVAGPARIRLGELCEDQGNPPQSDAVVACVPAPAWIARGKWNVLFTTIESREAHPGLVARARLWDQVWVPCEANKQALVSRGMPRRKVKVVPEGVDPSRWCPAGERVRTTPENVWTFGYHGDWSYRKGLFQLLRAWSDTFTWGEKVRLVLLVHYQGRTDVGAMHRMRQEMEGALGVG